MASSQPDQDQRGRLTPSSSVDQEQRGRTSTSSHPEQDQCKTMQGYPPSPGYQHGHSGGHPSGYQGYPPGYPSGPQPYPPHYQTYPGHPNPYPYAAAPPAAYYTSQPYLAPQPEPSGGIAFARAIFIIMFVLLLGTFCMSLITWVIFGSEVPRFQVESLSVPIFNVTDTSFNAKWEANVTAKNMDKKIDMLLHHIEAAVGYGSDALAIGLVDSLHLWSQREGSLVSKMEADDPKQNDIAKETMSGMIRDRSSGKVSFNLRMAIGATYTSGSMWRRHTRMRVFCDGLKVEFVAATGVGNLVPGGQEDCIVYM